MFYNYIIILFIKFIFFFIRFFSFGSGSTWPGHIALFLNRRIIRDILNKNIHLKIILIAGTNGKTTTSKMLSYALSKKGLSILKNDTGANLLNGIASSIIDNTSFFGKIDNQVAIFEVDENTLPQIIKYLNPTAVIILNLFRDQLDRYGEVNTISNKWLESFKKINSKTKFILNGDDPLLYFLGKKLKNEIYYFGVSKENMTSKNLSHDIDSNYCPECKNRLTYNAISYSHLGDFFCDKCGFKRDGVESDFSNLKYPLEGVYNSYNTNAVLLTLKKIFLFLDIDKDLFVGFKPAFGRLEEIVYKNKKITILLSKNPTGFNQSINLINQNLDKKNILILLNDRIPDGTDVSWIWDVDFDQLFKTKCKVFISGDRCYEMAIRLKDKKEYIYLYKDYKKAVNEMCNSLKNEKNYILPTYSAMLEVRNYLIGKKML